MRTYISSIYSCILVFFFIYFCAAHTWFFLYRIDSARVGARKGYLKLTFSSTDGSSPKLDMNIKSDDSTMFIGPRPDRRYNCWLILNNCICKSPLQLSLMRECLPVSGISKLCLFGSVSLRCGGDWIFSSSLPMVFRCLVQACHWVDTLFREVN